MGYYSNYTGEFHFEEMLTNDEVNIIYERFKNRFGWYECTENEVKFVKIEGNTNKYYFGDLYFDTHKQMVVPTLEHMKGYDFNQHTYEICQFVKALGYHLYGVVERVGEESGDKEKILVKDNSVFVSRAKMVWSAEMEFTETEAQKKERFKKMFRK